MADKFDFSLYAITGENYHPGRPMLDVMEQALIGGAEVVQLRDKTSANAELLEKAKQLRVLTSRYGVPLIVNDHPELALAAGADGVHLGQDDMPIREARELLGPDRLIGISTHNIEQARAAQREGADYIGVGPVYPTGTKPGRAAVTTGYVRQAAAEIAIPFVAIGGITIDNADEVLAAGARRLCAVSAVVGSADPAGVCRALIGKIRSFQEDMGSIVRITVNGKETLAPVSTVEELVSLYGLESKRIVVELDGVIVRREEWGRIPLKAGARLELVHFVGGG